VPLVEDESKLRTIYEQLEGLLLTGGGDVDPKLYGEPRHAATCNVHPRRDRVEARLIGWALSDGMPLLAICRGMQILNVALGGTLYQDVGSQLPGSLRHDCYPDFSRNHIAHQIAVKPRSGLSAIVATVDLPVNSTHHQGVRAPAPDLTVVARAPDGLIEGLEYQSHPFALGVQWHPEDLIAHDPRMGQLFEAFVKATLLCLGDVPG
jgi:putative glutamine amidotransferase